jgi:hypothetical protein
MSLQPFTRNFRDNSTEAEFQFTFYCDECGDGYKTKFIESKTHKKRTFLRKFSDAVSAAGRFTGTGSWSLGHGYESYPPEWHKEHEKAFEKGWNEARAHFHKCPKCVKHVCDNCWNEQTDLCAKCSPREAVEVAVARADKMVKDIRTKADETEVFTGEVEKRTTICPECGQPAGEGKFCINCGAPLAQTQCPNCGAQLKPGIKFCSECGTKL